MNLADINVIIPMLEKAGFSFKKSLGQNFLTDSSVCPEMARLAADRDTGVLEIGPGVGVLTKELCAVAGKTVAVELDERLKKVLPITLGDCENLEIVWGDAMKLDLNALIKEKFGDMKKISVCANLPYYITSPLITSLLESRLDIDSIVVMVQKEAAERICAEVGTREAGALSVAVSYYSVPEILFNVDRSSFYPVPKVDSAVIRLNVLKAPAVSVKDEKFFFKFVKACFAQRRKTLANSVSNTLGIGKETVYTALESLNLDKDIRSEKLTLKELALISDILL